jgi:hypothetical protein
MTAERAREMGREFFDDHPAAAPLILSAIHHQDPEVRRRSGRALEQLDPDNPANVARRETAHALAVIDRALEAAGR